MDAVAVGTQLAFLSSGRGGGGGGGGRQDWECAMSRKFVVIGQRRRWNGWTHPYLRVAT